MDWKRLKEQNNIGRTGNVAHGNPLDFVIVGLDDGYSFDEVAARLDDERDLLILKYAVKDTARLEDEIPDWFVEGFALTGGHVDPAAFWQVIDKHGKSLPLLTNGRSRCMGLRIENEKRAKDEKDPFVLDALADTFLSKNPSVHALRMKRFRNRHIPDSLAVLAEAAGDFADLGEKADGIAKEMGCSVERAGELVAWAPLFPKFCAEARRRANDGRLRLRGAQELVRKFPSKAEQEAYFAGKTQLRGKTDAPRPLSPRLLGLFADQAATEKKATVSEIALIRLANGDKAAIEDLSPGLKAAWIRAEEQSKTRKRGRS